jgi:hypothetical protein
MNRIHRVGRAKLACIALALLPLAACSSTGSGAQTQAGPAAHPTPIALAPSGIPGDGIRQPGPSRLGVTDVTKENSSVPGSAQPTIIDTRTFPKLVDNLFPGEPHLVREHLPPHKNPAPAADGEPNALQAEKTLEVGRTNAGPMFPAITATGWTPPDPTLAVGPSHVVVTVNSKIAFYTKAGAQTFSAPLDSSGSPGFFEPLGAGGFVFDPKCFFDHYAQRFVVVALETYGTTEAWVDIAISDDADPNGTWYKYRTDAVLTIGTSTAWWDFPGAGYDQNAYYITGNLFGLNPASGYYGFALRVFDKSTMLAGGTAAYNTLRVASGYVVQPALHFGNPSNAFLVTATNSTTLTVYAVNNPLTSPTLSSVNVAMPSYSGAASAPTINGSDVSSAGMTMPMWRNGKLYVCHNGMVGGRNVARWHELNTGTWPASGTVTRTQSGDIDAGGLNWTVFPAIGVNAAGQLGVALGQSSVASRVAVSTAGRLPTDPVGRMGVPTVVKPGDSDGGGRWGDYYAVAIDPTDDTTFWHIGEYRGTSNWQTWVGSFTVGTQSPCHAVPDHAGTVIIPASPLAIDVLANDWHSSGAAMTIQSFSAATTRGGTITRSVGTGPGGRDRLLYIPPTLSSGVDSFTYVIADSSGNTATAAVTVFLLDPSTFRVPDQPFFTAAGVNVSYYDLVSPTVLPNFSTLTPFLTGNLPDINIASTTGVFSTSTRSDNLGAVYEGYINVPTDNVYTLSVESDDGSKLYVGSTLLINNDGAHGMTEKFGDIGLKAGRHKIRVEYYEGGGGAGLIVRYRPLGGTRATVPSSMWTRATPCAPDFNGIGGVTVQDIFDFLGAWFAGNPRADFNGANGINVQDIFDFLAAWFTGC